MVRPCPEEILPSGSCCLPSLWWVIPLQRPLPVCIFHWIQYDNKIGKQVTKIWQNWDNAVQIFSLKSSRLSLKAMSHGCFRQTLCMYYYYYFFCLFLMTDIQIYRVYHWHHDKWPFTGFCIFWGWSGLAVCFQARYDHWTDSSAVAV